MSLPFLAEEKCFFCTNDEYKDDKGLRTRMNFLLDSVMYGLCHYSLYIIQFFLLILAACLQSVEHTVTSLYHKTLLLKIKFQ